jgi:hypothetical protein
MKSLRAELQDAAVSPRDLSLSAYWAVGYIEDSVKAGEAHRGGADLWVMRMWSRTLATISALVSLGPRKPFLVNSK